MGVLRITRARKKTLLAFLNTSVGHQCGLPYASGSRAQGDSVR
jgi:hypothetical protein